MSSYVSRPVEVESMRWCELGCDDPEVHARCHDSAAFDVIRWVNANCGEARYDPARSIEFGIAIGGQDMPARIAVRTVNGWAYATPGHYIVKGDATYCGSYPAHMGSCAFRGCEVRDFYPCDPVTFEKRWTLKEQTT